MTVNGVNNGTNINTVGTSQKSSNDTNIRSASANNSVTKPNSPAIVNPSSKSNNTESNNEMPTTASSSPKVDTVDISDNAKNTYKTAPNDKEVNKKDNNVKNDNDRKGPLEYIKNRVEAFFS